MRYQFSESSFSESSRSRGSLRAQLGIAGMVLALFASAGAFGATASNANSGMGMNLGPVTYYTDEQPFLNIFKTTGVTQGNPAGWWTHSNKTYTWDTNEEAYLQLDANGYPTTLAATPADPNSPQKFDSVGVLVLRNLGKANGGKGQIYPSGQYVVLYDGQGTMAYGTDATLVSSSPGRDVINVSTTTRGGIDLRINATDPNHTGNYIRNIRIVKAENESLLASGGIFNPVFLNLLQNFHVVRGMQWLNTDSDGGKLVNWAQRPQLSDAGYGGPNGTPIESVLQLCNAVGADCWVNVPHMANNDFITQMATLTHTMLGSSQKVYIEYSNEVWNTDYPQQAYALAQGQATWPNAGAGADYRNSWYGMRASQTCDIWKSIWGTDAARVVCVLGAQAANPWIATEALKCSLWTGTGNAPCASHGFGAVAIAPYFDVQPATAAAWTGAADGGLTSLFQALNDTAVPQTTSWAAAYKAALAPYNLPFIAYEGGPGLVAFPHYSEGSPVANLFMNANRDPRMGAALTAHLNGWKANGGQMYVIFNDIEQPSVYGEFGVLESVWDTVSPLSAAPAKWQALQGFIAANSCWWTGCAGTIAGTTSPIPMPPSNVTVK